MAARCFEERLSQTTNIPTAKGVMLYYAQPQLL